MVGMVAMAYATLGQRWLQVGKPAVVFSTSAHCRYRRLSSMYLLTVGQRWLKVINPTVILSTSAHRHLHTSILRAFADIGPTLAQGKKANGHFVNVSPPSATDVYPPVVCRHWANVGSK